MPLCVVSKGRSASGMSFCTRSSVPKALSVAASVPATTTVSAIPSSIMSVARPSA
jgi:hypothetical protein